MFLRRTVAAFSATSLLLCACQPANPTNVYSEAEMGKDTVVLYGFVKSSRIVQVQGTNSGTGALVGAAAGGGAGSAIGSGNGSIAAVIAGVVIGGMVGAAAEQSMRDQQGFEYIIQFPDTGDTRSIVQPAGKEPAPAIANGQCVMVQMGGSFQRVIPTEASDCPKPSKRKIKRTKTQVKTGNSETTIERQ